MHNEQPSPYELQQRQKKQKQILRMIYTYRRTPQEIRALQKLKSTTKMEINLRFMNCKHNKTYVFPLQQDDSSQKDEEQQFSTTNQIYDLNTQEPIIKKTISTKNLEISQSSRRIKSLQKERIHGDQPMIAGKFKRKMIEFHKNNTLAISKSKQRIQRKNSLTDRKNVLSAIKLPNLKTKQLRQSPKSPKINLQDVVGKKMMTQASPDPNKYERYLRNIQQINKRTKPKKFFLQEC